MTRLHCCHKAVLTRAGATALLAAQQRGPAISSVVINAPGVSGSAGENNIMATGTTTRALINGEETEYVA